MELPKPLPYTISPESSKPKVEYLPSFGNIIVPGKTAVREEFLYGGYPGRTFEGYVTDRVETFLAAPGNEVIGRTVTLAPTMFVDDEARAHFPQPKQARLLRDIMDTYEWVLDERSFTIRPRPPKGASYSERASFSLFVAEDAESVPYTDYFPELGDRLYLEDNPDRVTLHHVETEGGGRLFEKIVHLENGPGGRTFPVYIGVLYDADLLDFPKLHEVALINKYNPAVIRQKILPFVSVKYD